MSSKIKEFDARRAPLSGRVLVEASAGSGKTYSLILLTLRLILEKKLPIEKIAILTYTRKAAEEIRERLQRELERMLATLMQMRAVEDFESFETAASETPTSKTPVSETAALAGDKSDPRLNENLQANENPQALKENPQAADENSAISINDAGASINDAGEEEDPPVTLALALLREAMQRAGEKNGTSREAILRSREALLRTLEQAAWGLPEATINTFHSLLQKTFMSTPYFLGSSRSMTITEKSTLFLREELLSFLNRQFYQTSKNPYFPYFVMRRVGVRQFYETLKPLWERTEGIALDFIKTSPKHHDYVPLEADYLAAKKAFVTHCTTHLTGDGIFAPLFKARNPVDSSPELAPVIELEKKNMTFLRDLQELIRLIQRSRETPAQIGLVLTWVESVFGGRAPTANLFSIWETFAYKPFDTFSVAVSDVMERMKHEMEACVEREKPRATSGNTSFFKREKEAVRNDVLEGLVVSFFDYFASLLRCAVFYEWVYRYFLYEAYTDVRIRVRERRERMGVLTYEDLVQRMDEGMRDGAKDSNKFPVLPYEAVMIDEFQDTNRRLYKIVDIYFASTPFMFLIGDPKQSIYSFQGADLDAYLRMSETIKAASNGRRYTLSHNYRSHPRLLAAINHLYGAVEDPFYSQGKVKYLAMDAARKETPSARKETSSNDQPSSEASLNANANTNANANGSFSDKQSSDGSSLSGQSSNTNANANGSFSDKQSSDGSSFNGQSSTGAVTHSAGTSARLRIWFSRRLCESKLSNKIFSGVEARRQAIYMLIIRELRQMERLHQESRLGAEKLPFQWSGIAILVKSNTVAEALTQRLRRAGVPIRFMRRLEVERPKFRTSAPRDLYYLLLAVLARDPGTRPFLVTRGAVIPALNVRRMALTLPFFVCELHEHQLTPASPTYLHAFFDALFELWTRVGCLAMLETFLWEALPDELVPPLRQGHSPQAGNYGKQGNHGNHRDHRDHGESGGVNPLLNVAKHFAHSEESLMYLCELKVLVQALGEDEAVLAEDPPQVVLHLMRQCLEGAFLYGEEREPGAFSFARGASSSSAMSPSELDERLRVMSEQVDADPWAFLRGWIGDEREMTAPPISKASEGAETPAIQGDNFVGDNFVKVYTLHSSKGLEFDTVILPFLMEADMKIDKKKLKGKFFKEKNAETDTDSGENRQTENVKNAKNTMAERWVIELLRKTPRLEVAEDAAQELTRILYVALTRARERVIAVAYSQSLAGTSDFETEEQTVSLPCTWSALLGLTGEDSKTKKATQRKSDRTPSEENLDASQGGRDAGNDGDADSEVANASKFLGHLNQDLISVEDVDTILAEEVEPLLSDPSRLYKNNLENRNNQADQVSREPRRPSQDQRKSSPVSNQEEGVVQDQDEARVRAQDEARVRYDSRALLAQFVERVNPEWALRNTLARQRWKTGYRSSFSALLGKYLLHTEPNIRSGESSSPLSPEESMTPSQERNFFLAEAYDDSRIADDTFSEGLEIAEQASRERGLTERVEGGAASSDESEGESSQEWEAARAIEEWENLMLMQELGDPASMPVNQAAQMRAEAPVSESGNNLVSAQENHFANEGESSLVSTQPVQLKHLPSGRQTGLSFGQFFHALIERLLGENFLSTYTSANTDAGARGVDDSLASQSILSSHTQAEKSADQRVLENSMLEERLVRTIREELAAFPELMRTSENAPLENLITELTGLIRTLWTTPLPDIPRNKVNALPPPANSSQRSKRMLASLGSEDLICEMEFVLPTSLAEKTLGAELRACVRGDHGTRTASPLPAKHKLLSLQSKVGSMAVGAFDNIDRPPFVFDKGFVHGFIDLFFKLDGRYYILDWKTNDLHSAFMQSPHYGQSSQTAQSPQNEGNMGNIENGYHHSALAATMRDCGYDVQAAIYMVAAHRHLQAWLGKDYQYEESFGGVIYAFVRGIAHPQTQGMFFERYSEAALQSLDRLFTPA